jgi:hypothetical protein
MPTVRRPPSAHRLCANRLSDTNSALSPSDQLHPAAEILNVPQHYQVVSAKRNSDGPPIAHDVTHTIRVRADCPPVKQAPYRTSPATNEFIKSQIDLLLSKGLIEPSTSPWASPVLVVPQADGSKRMVIDYRALNKHAEKDG